MRHHRPVPRVICLLTVLVLFSTAAWAGIPEDVRLAYESGDYVKAAALCRTHAERGDSQAQIFLGMLYHKGYGVKQDNAEALSWFFKAANKK
ncbi:MAG TPA: hypothetical protein PLR71_15130, partial [Deltaproteobacteria bacterium]|nr:hypothetical protein [Deltaproteobacteria bacterium]